MRKIVGLSLSLFILVMAAGCSRYYQVRDPASDSLFYTQNIDEKRGGSIVFQDDKTGSLVTLQSSEVKEISEHEFQGALQSVEKTE